MTPHPVTAMLDAPKKRTLVISEEAVTMLEVWLSLEDDRRDSHGRQWYSPHEIAAMDELREALDATRPADG